MWRTHPVDGIMEIVPGASSDDCYGEDGFMEAGERLEDDEDLKLFAMGERAIFTERRIYNKSVLGDQLLRLATAHQPRCIQTNHGQAIADLPTRWLQPTCVKTLWYQFGGPGSKVSYLACAQIVAH